jgi:hypothetical protein
MIILSWDSCDTRDFVLVVANVPQKIMSVLAALVNAPTLNPSQYPIDNKHPPN